jgi:hypothetical protein
VTNALLALYPDGHNLPQSGMARLAVEFFGLHQ